MSNGVPILQTENICKTFDDGTLKVQVLKNINLQVMPGERIAIIGSSGSGKTTLLHLLGGLDKPSSGHVSVLGEHFSSLGEVQRGRIRNRVIGFVYQFHHLLPEFTALENVAMPLLIGGDGVIQARDKAMAMLAQVGLDHRLHHKPSELSGGERQRAAVARALVTHPRILLADEPTGNLDHKTAARVFDLMLDIQKERDTSIVVVTHDPSIAERMDRIISIEDGVIKGS